MKIQMTKEEAKAYLKKLKPISHQALLACDIGIDAINKQIPQKKHKYMGYRCICGEEVAKNQRYCEYCGQALLDWEEEK